MDNTRIIPVRFGKERLIVTEYRMQYDYGQVLDFIDIVLPEAFEARFSNSVSGKSVGQIGSNNQVRIPKQFFESGEPIYCYVTVHDEVTDGRTLYTTKVPIKPSPERTEEEPEPEEESIITQAITALNNAVDVTSQKALEASESADRAEHAAEGIEAYVERAEAAQSASESARDRAVTAETNSRTFATASAQSAEQAEQIKTYVEGIVDDAQASADASYQNAQSAYRYAQDSATSAGQAESYANDASDYASDAQVHSQTAISKASEASQSAQTASQKASEASQSASTAVQAKTDAITAKTASETAQGLAESARDGAVSAKTGAESARDEAQEIVDGITGKVEQIDSNTERIESLEDDRYKAFVTDTASGAVVSFPDGADDIPLKSLVVNIEPVQAGSGDPSPDNIRPISGWTGCEVQRTGKNLLNADTYYGDYKQSDGSYLLSASALSIILIPLKAFIGKTVTLSAEVTIGETTTNLGARAFINGRGTNGTQATTNATSTTSITATPVTDDDYIHITYGSGGSNLVTLRNVQLEEGSAVTTYESFGRTYPITFPPSTGTIYGGYVDVINGELVVDRAYEVLNNPDKWYETSGTANFRYDVPFDSRKIYDDSYSSLTCSYVPCSYGAEPYGRWNSASGTDFCIKSSALTLEQVRADAEDGKISIVYELAEPIHCPLTPTEIKTLLGQNNLWADTGDTEVEYRADTKTYLSPVIDDYSAALRALGVI